MEVRMVDKERRERRMAGTDQFHAGTPALVFMSATVEQKWLALLLPPSSASAATLSPVLVVQWIFQSCPVS